MYFATRAFWADLAERTVSTAAQAGLGFVAAAAFVPSLESVKAAAITAGTAGAIAVLKAFAVGRGTTPPPPAPAADVPALAAPVAPVVISGGGVTSVYPPAGV